LLARKVLVSREQVPADFESWLMVVTSCAPGFVGANFADPLISVATMWNRSKMFSALGQ
jgi:hypothetical protein